MADQFSKGLIPVWKQLGLSDYEIHWLVHKLHYDFRNNIPDLHRELTDEKDMIINWINIGLTDAEIARLLCVGVSHADKQVRAWENGDELWEKLNESHDIRRTQINKLP